MSHWPGTPVYLALGPSSGSVAIRERRNGPDEFLVRARKSLLDCFSVPANAVIHVQAEASTYLSPACISCSFDCHRGAFMEITLTYTFHYSQNCNAADRLISRRLDKGLQLGTERCYIIQ